VKLFILKLKLGYTEYPAAVFDSFSPLLPGKDTHAPIDSFIAPADPPGSWCSRSSTRPPPAGRCRAAPIPPHAASVPTQPASTSLSASMRPFQRRWRHPRGRQAQDWDAVLLLQVAARKFLLSPRSCTAMQRRSSSTFEQLMPRCGHADA
jgi:hypothetical protein